MKQRALQILFISAALIVAYYMVHLGTPATMAPALSQSKNVPPMDTGPQIASSEVRKEVIKPILLQLQDMKKNDYADAIFYESEGLQQAYPGVDSFRSMVENNYPAFIHYQSVKFGRCFTDDDYGKNTMIMVHLTEPGGERLRIIYSMVKEPTGYKVDDVEGGRVFGAKLE